jgi:AcrR family transcriptional regulator
MAKSAKSTRQGIIDAAYVLFYRLGFNRINMNEIAASAGVTKRTLYYHFRSKDDLLAEVLDVQSDLALAAFRTFGDKLTGSPEQVVEILFSELAKWSRQPRWPGSGFTRVAFELADLPGHPARAIARRHKALLEAGLADVFDRAGLADAQSCAREIYLLVEGAATLILIHSDVSYAEAAAGAGRSVVRAAERKGMELPGGGIVGNAAAATLAFFPEFPIR